MKKLNRVLLVDDDDVNNFLSRQILEELDIYKHLVVLFNGKEALDYIIQECVIPDKLEIDLIILDHHMPVMDGKEFMEEFNKRHFKGKEDIKILLLGAHSTLKDLEMFKELGVHDFTSKPLSKETVLELYDKYWAEKS